MNISLNWLRDFVDWTGTPAELETLLIRTGIEVASVSVRGADIPHVVIAQIKDSQPHPNADRLSVCQVDDGSGQPRQIVCGAKNYQIGDKVPLALPGAVLPGDFKIKTGKLRGVESEGMLCSAKELRLAEDAQGLLILPADAPVGQSLSAIFPSDAILEVELTPNRGDWQSHLGVAREVAAFSGQTLRGTQSSPPAAAPGPEVRSEALELCPFYTARRVESVKVSPSPQWLRDRLEAVGSRSINNVVDVTNYVMLELGQPLHAFDAAKVRGPLTAREARAGEKLTALDGSNLEFAGGELVIADDNGPLALAGVMGGSASSVTADTTDVLLESALFQSSGIRRTARKFSLHTDSSHRFERGVDPAGVLVASERAAQLLTELAGGRAGSPVSAGVLPAAAAPVTVNENRCRALLGLEVSADQIHAALKGLGLALAKSEGDSSTWIIPSHRGDLLRDVDLIEEVVRVVGIENIPSRLSAAPAAPGEADAVYDFQMTLRQTLAGLGFHEARTSTLVSESMLWQGIAPIRLRNPLGEDQAFLRPSLIPGLLAALERNIRYGAKTVRLYEVGRTFRAGESEQSPTLSFLLWGSSVTTGWRQEAERPLDWHDAKGVFESLTGISAQWTQTEAQAPLGLAATAEISGAVIGLLGQLSPSAARMLDAAGQVVVGEIDLAALRRSAVASVYREVNKFPAVTRDIAVIAPLATSYAEIARTLLDAQEDLLEGVTPFDIFTDPSGKKLTADCKSVALSLTFRATERTLNSEEVTAACDRLRQRLKEKLGVSFRE